MSRDIRREFETSHPWLRFQLNLKHTGAAFWTLLGIVAARIERLQSAPLTPATHNEIHQLFLAKGVAATTAIEGNTLSEEEVLQHMRGELQVPKSKAYLQKEVDNMISAFGRLYRDIHDRGQISTLTPQLIEDYHRIVLKGLEDRLEDGTPGVLRSFSVVVGNVYRGAPAVDLEFLMARYCEWLNGPDFRSEDSTLQTPFAILRAIVAHLYFAWIHPFADGNGRTARLIEFHLLLEAGLPSPAAHLLSNHYNQTRSEYYRQLAAASRSGGDAVPFLQYAIQGFADGLDAQWEIVKQQIWEFAWESYVVSQLGDVHGERHERLQAIATGLGRIQFPFFRHGVPIQEIAELSPALTRYYGRKSTRTLLRDLKELRERELIEEFEGGYVAKLQVLEAFVPPRQASVRR